MSEEQTAQDSACESRDLTVVNALGMHARPAAMFVKTAAGFSSTIMVRKDGSEVNGKSIMGLMTLEACKGTILTVSAEGDDSTEALNAIQQLIESGFNES